jgi:hypothetical protein
VSLEKMSSATRVRRLVAGVLVCGSIAGVASIDLATSPAAGAARGSLHTARAAAAPKAVQVNQTMVMSVASIQGNTITAHGQEVTGQINGIISFSLTLQNGSRTFSRFSIDNNGHIGSNHRKGTIEGDSTGNYHVSGAQSHFTGRIVSIHGTEELAHAQNLGIAVSGTLNRRTYKLTITMKGKYVE